MDYEFTVTPEEEAELPVRLANQLVLKPLFDRLNVSGFLHDLGAYEGIELPDSINEQINRFSRRLEISQSFQSKLAGIRDELDVRRAFDGMRGDAARAIHTAYFTGALNAEAPIVVRDLCAGSGFLGTSIAFIRGSSISGRDRTRVIHTDKELASLEENQAYVAELGIQGHDLHYNVASIDDAKVEFGRDKDRQTIVVASGACGGLTDTIINRSVVNRAPEDQVEATMIWPCHYDQIGWISPYPKLVRNWEWASLKAIFAKAPKEESDTPWSKAAVKAAMILDATRIRALQQVSGINVYQLPLLDPEISQGKAPTAILAMKGKVLRGFEIHSL